jgi:hypothetical protein
VSTAYDNHTIRTIEEKLKEVFPEEAIYLKNPEGSNARSDQRVSTFRKDWAKKQNISPEDYKKKASEIKKVEVKPSYNVQTLQKYLAEGMGIPPAAIVLVKPDGEKCDPSVNLSTFKGYWRK